METIQVANSQKLNLRILELYSQGLSYNKIQKILKKEFNEDFSKRALGEQMGQIKKEMKCATQFQMGYLYANNQSSKVISSIYNQIQETEIKSEEAFIKGLEAGKEQMKIALIPEIKKASFGYGLMMASIFWIALIVFIAIQL